jgi:hypothetical protein
MSVMAILQQSSPPHINKSKALIDLLRFADVTFARSELEDFDKRLAMSKLIFLVLLCRVPSAFVSAQDSGTDEYVTGMTVVGTWKRDSRTRLRPPSWGSGANVGTIRGFR